MFQVAETQKAHELTVWVDDYNTFTASVKKVDWSPEDVAKALYRLAIMIENRYGSRD